MIVTCKALNVFIACSQLEQLDIITWFSMPFQLWAIIRNSILICTLTTIFISNCIFVYLPCNLQVAAESVKLYVAITDGVLILVDKVHSSFLFFLQISIISQ